MMLCRKLMYATVLSFVLRQCSSETKQQWMEMATEELDRALKLSQNTNIAKNVILVIGDGMGLSSVTGARALKGQMSGHQGKQPPLSFEAFPNVGLSKTYSNDRLVSMSASTATALMSGVKVNDGTIGLGPGVAKGDCPASLVPANRIDSILQWSLEKGKSVGVVTTSRVTHATPAGAYAHTPNRYWEGETEVGEGCKDIAAQMIDNMDLTVVLGGGRRYFLLDNQTDPQTGTIHGKHRTDGRDLIKEWGARHLVEGRSASYVYNKEQFDAVVPANTDRLMGMFGASHMSYDADRDSGPQGQPSLAEMSRKAIQILKKNDNGFFLMVEGARIDHAHHDNYGKRALLDVLALDRAVSAILSETDQKETLVVVTADHSHVFNIAGYTLRDTDILGFADIVADNEAPFDKMPYTTLVYGNGPGPGRTNLTGKDTSDLDFQQTAAVRMQWETHSGEDVGVYALGPMSHLLHGVHEQHYIAHVMAYASCVGSGRTRCEEAPHEVCVGASGALRAPGNVLLMLAVFLQGLCIVARGRW